VSNNPGLEEFYSFPFPEHSPFCEQSAELTKLVNNYNIHHRTLLNHQHLPTSLRRKEDQKFQDLSGFSELQAQIKTEVHFSLFTFRSTLILSTSGRTFTNYSTNPNILFSTVFYLYYLIFLLNIRINYKLLVIWISSSLSSHTYDCNLHIFKKYRLRFFKFLFPKLKCSTVKIRCIMFSISLKIISSETLFVEECWKLAGDSKTSPCCLKSKRLLLLLLLLLFTLHLLFSISLC
jgi:hypothetical protein